MNEIKVVKEKSQIVQFFLIVGFQSLGLFYSTALGAFVMSFLFAPVIIYILLQGYISYAIGITLLYYPICFIWGALAVKSSNKGSVTPIDNNMSLNEVLEAKERVSSVVVHEDSEPLDSPLLRLVGFVLLGVFCFLCLYGCFDLFSA